MVEPKRVSRRLRVLLYVGINFGNLVVFGAQLLDGPSEFRLAILLLTLAFWNLLFWFMFRMKDKEVDAFIAKKARIDDVRRRDLS
jgi:4-hydroxybenzoate polyprenyltransferase